VTTFRREGAYLDGRRPETVEFHSEIEVDLARRDFTINAMAFDPVSGLWADPFGGRADLERKLVRCVREPRERFEEDGLRCLRAVRFATVLDFTVDPATLAAIAPALAVFKKVALERVRDELAKLLAAPQAPRGLKLLESTGLMAASIPEALGADYAAVTRVAELDSKWAVLFARAPAPRAPVERLRLSNRSIDLVSALVTRQQPPPPTADDRALRGWIRDVGLEALAAQLDVSAALGYPIAALRPRVEKLKHDPLTPRQLALDGAQLMAALGVGPGPVVGKATRFLMDAVLANPALNTPESLRELLKAMPR
jgi:tRNA nucleotidyltransferase (CCA-adding enzyme)